MVLEANYFMQCWWMMFWIMINQHFHFQHSWSYQCRNISIQVRPFTMCHWILQQLEYLLYIQMFDDFALRMATLMLNSRIFGILNGIMWWKVGLYILASRELNSYKMSMSCSTCPAQTWSKTRQSFWLKIVKQMQVFALFHLSLQVKFLLFLKCSGRSH